jgi:hypothetical protein
VVHPPGSGTCPACPMLVPLPTDSRCGRGPRSKPPSSSGLGLRPFKAAARVRIPLGVRSAGSTTERARCKAQWRSWLARRPVTAKVAGSSPVWVAPSGGRLHRPARPGSSVGTSDRLKSGRSAVRPRPWPSLFEEAPQRAAGLLSLRGDAGDRLVVVRFVAGPTPALRITEFRFPDSVEHFAQREPGEVLPLEEPVLGYST